MGPAAATLIKPGFVPPFAGKRGGRSQVKMNHVLPGCKPWRALYQSARDQEEGVARAAVALRQRAAAGDRSEDLQQLILTTEGWRMTLRTLLAVLLELGADEAGVD